MTSSKEFAKTIRDALAHLYDAAHLQGHPLVQALVPDPPSDAVSGAQALRRVLLDTIETLRPDGQIPYTAREWRPYRVLFARYVQRQGTPCILLDLAISERQYQREHARALGAVTDLLWQQAQRLSSSKSAPPADDATRAIQHLVSGAQREALDCGQLVRSTIEAIEKLAASRRITIEYVPDSSFPLIYGDRGLLRQVMLGILSHLLAQREDDTLVITMRQQGDQARFGYAMQAVASDAMLPSDALPRKLALSQRIAQAIGGQCWVSERSIELSLPIERQVLLVVDDSVDVIELFERYTANSAYRVVGAQTAENAMALAREHHPFLITIDVMMPTHDGWELLQSLKHSPETFDIPVAVCSVLNEAELAISLGADDYLTKPVSQASFLRLLSRWRGTAATE